VELEKTLAEQYSLMQGIKTEDGVLSIGSTRTILFSSKAFVFLAKSIYRHAPQAVKFLFYDAGYRTGEEFVSTLAQASDDKEELMQYAVEFFKQAGYGNFELAEFDLGRPYVRIVGTNLFEASLADEIGIFRTPRTVDHYSRGMFAGFFSQLLGIEVVCEEMSCQAKGDEVCTFVVMPFVE
jgi:predicted hydrocarbon binding protein